MDKIKNLWFNLDNKIRFFVIGCVNAAISYLLFIIFILIFGENRYQLCLFLQWIISTIPSYFNQKFFVFCTKGSYLKEYIKCLSTWAVAYFLNAGFLEIFNKFLIKDVFISQFISLILVSVVTYVLFKYFAFKKK